MTILAGVSRRTAAALAALTLLSAGPLLAHEGEEHGAEENAAAAAAPVAAAASGEAHSDRYEVVVTGGEDVRMTVYLDDYATNAPIADARVVVVLGERQLAARAVSPGTYEARLPQPLPHGRTDLDVLVQGPAGDDLLSVPIVVPEHEAAAAEGVDWRSAGLGAVAILILAALGVGAWAWLRRRPAAAAIMLALAGVAVFAPGAGAHEDEPHGDEPAAAEDGEAAVAGDRPMRAADGSVVLPKPSQRLLAVRTVIGSAGDGAAASRLQAQVIPDPARFARLATARGGRLVGSFPRPGQAVSAGQTLFQLQPALSAADAASSGAEVRSLDREVRLAEQELRRLEQLRGIVARAEIERARTNLAGLRAQRGAAAGPVQGLEAIRSPISGTVSTVSTALGAVAEPGAVLAEVVGNGGWLIEARGLAPGQRIAGSTAVGVTADGRRIGLRLLGRSPQLVDGADRFLFAPTEGAASLRGGEGLTVEAVLVGAAVQRGVVLPSDAVVRGEGGEAVVWVKPSALRFVPRQVRTQPLPGGRVLVLGGVRPGERVVTQAAALLGQIR